MDKLSASAKAFRRVYHFAFWEKNCSSFTTELETLMVKVNTDPNLRHFLNSSSIYDGDRVMIKASSVSLLKSFSGVNSFVTKVSEF